MPLPQRTANNPPLPRPSAFVAPVINRRLGSGLRFPKIFDQVSQTWDTIGGADKLQQSILICLRTPVNRRLGQADYGSELPYMVFEQYTTTLKQEMIRQTQLALQTWVKGITVNQVFVDPSLIDNNTVVLIIQYLINGTSVLDTVRVALQNGTNDQVQLPPNTFTINGVSIIKGA